MMKKNTFDVKTARTQLLPLIRGLKSTEAINIPLKIQMELSSKSAAFYQPEDVLARKTPQQSLHGFPDLAGVTLSVQDVLYI